MQKPKIYIYNSKRGTGKTTFLNYLLKIKTFLHDTHKTLVCISNKNLTFEWNHINKKFWLTSLGKHSIDKYIKYIFVDNLDLLNNFQISYLKKDLNINNVEKIYCTISSNFDYSKIFSSEKYDIIEINANNFYLNIFQKLVNKVL